MEISSSFLDGLFVELDLFFSLFLVILICGRRPRFSEAATTEKKPERPTEEGAADHTDEGQGQQSLAYNAVVNAASTVDTR